MLHTLGYDCDQYSFEGPIGGISTSVDGQVHHACRASKKSYFDDVTKFHKDTVEIDISWMFPVRDTVMINGNKYYTDTIVSAIKHMGIFKVQEGPGSPYRKKDV